MLNTCLKCCGIGTLLRTKSIDFKEVLVSDGIHSWVHTDAWSVGCLCQQKKEGKKSSAERRSQGVGRTDFRLAWAGCEMAPQGFGFPYHPMRGTCRQLPCPCPPHTLPLPPSCCSHCHRVRAAYISRSRGKLAHQRK